MPSHIIRALFELVAPPACAACALPVGDARVAFCDACAPLLERPSAALRAPHPGGTAFVYAGPMAEAIVGFKYHGHTERAGPLGALLAAEAASFAGQVARVVPLPLHPERLRERGFNQAALLGQPVARALGVALDTGLLARTRPTVAQASLPRARRELNVRGAFRARGRCDEPLLLVDDVRTTGASLAEAARTLRAAGAPVVHTLALARAPG